MKVDTQILEALARVKVHEPKFVEWLEGRLAKHRDDAVMQRDDIDLRLAQGRGQEVKDILKLLADSQNILRKAGSRSS